MLCQVECCAAEVTKNEFRISNFECRMQKQLESFHSEFIIRNPKFFIQMNHDENRTQKLVRAVGLWGLVAMCINAVVGSGVFLLPTESYKLLGAFSLWAPLIFAVPVFILVLCFAEAASHFSETGRASLSARSPFGGFIGFETGWMNWLARVTSLAALSNGFVVSLARIFPPLG